jgi:pimeloyl-ACP methyl ester carboxylesterase
MKPSGSTCPARGRTLGGYRDAVVEQLQGGDILVGHSMGVAVAVVAADARPDLIGHITLLSGPLRSRASA